jgi:hypothetical protein
MERPFIKKQMLSRCQFRRVWTTFLYRCLRSQSCSAVPSIVASSEASRKLQVWGFKSSEARSVTSLSLICLAHTSKNFKGEVQIHFWFLFYALKISRVSCLHQSLLI